MKVLNYKQRIIDVVIEKGKEYAVGYSVTLNMLINDPILQDIQIQKLIKWLNFYCYGNNFRRNKKRLYVVGASEIGTVNQGLHMHLIIMHNYDTDRKTKDIEDFIWKKWHVLINSTSKTKSNGKLVYFERIYDLVGLSFYNTKTLYHFSNEFNLQYF